MPHSASSVPRRSAARHAVRGRVANVPSPRKELCALADWTRGEPAYLQVAEDLRQKIRGGQLQPGEQLPSYSALMRDYDVSITVARSAVGELRAEGLVSTHQGKGAFVLEGASEAAVPRDAVIASLRRDLDALTARVARLESERADPS
ncbi:winged helix-turn-helix domain-containing protein [Pseudonocardia sp.]|uniref:winged helix-turn-helix domain-containing protein n=1 Tax=Pseudonocardia sp. TaxID=60912 RepID=UPI003D0CF800